MGTIQPLINMLMGSILQFLPGMIQSLMGSLGG